MAKYCNGCDTRHHDNEPCHDPKDALIDQKNAQLHAYRIEIGKLREAFNSIPARYKNHCDHLVKLSEKCKDCETKVNQPKIKLVICGNHREWYDFMASFNGKIHSKSRIEFRLSDGTRFIYVSERDQMRGICADEVIFYGTSYLRKDIQELRQEASIMEMRNRAQ